MSEAKDIFTEQLIAQNKQLEELVVVKNKEANQLRDRVDELWEQNKRYREALQQIAQPTYVGMSAEERFCREIAQAALKDKE